MSSTWAAYCHTFFHSFSTSRSCHALLVKRSVGTRVTPPGMGESSHSSGGMRSGVGIARQHLVEGDALRARTLGRLAPGVAHVLRDRRLALRHDHVANPVAGVPHRARVGVLGEVAGAQLLRLLFGLRGRFARRIELRRHLVDARRQVGSAHVLEQVRVGARDVALFPAPLPVEDAVALALVDAHPAIAQVVVRRAADGMHFTSHREPPTGRPAALRARNLTPVCVVGCGPEACRAVRKLS